MNRDSVNDITKLASQQRGILTPKVLQDSLATSPALLELDQRLPELQQAIELHGDKLTKQAKDLAKLVRCISEKDVQTRALISLMNERSHRNRVTQSTRTILKLHEINMNLGSKSDTLSRHLADISEQQSEQQYSLTQMIERQQKSLDSIEDTIGISVQTLARKVAEIDRRVWNARRPMQLEETMGWLRQLCQQLVASAITSAMTATVVLIATRNVHESIPEPATDELSKQSTLTGGAHGETRLLETYIGSKSATLVPSGNMHTGAPTIAAVVGFSWEKASSPPVTKPTLDFPATLPGPSGSSTPQDSSTNTSQIANTDARKKTSLNIPTKISLTSSSRTSPATSQPREAPRAVLPHGQGNPTPPHFSPGGSAQATLTPHSQTSPHLDALVNMNSRSAPKTPPTPVNTTRTTTNSIVAPVMSTQTPAKILKVLFGKTTAIRALDYTPTIKPVTTTLQQSWVCCRCGSSNSLALSAYCSLCQYAHCSSCTIPNPLPQNVSSSQTPPQPTPIPSPSKPLPVPSPSTPLSQSS